MALTVVKYQKTPTGAMTQANQAIIIKKEPIISEGQYLIKKHIKLEKGGAIVLNKIPAVIKPATPATVKRVTSNINNQPSKISKYSVQSVGGSSSSLPSFQWQNPNNASAIAIKKEQLGQALSSLPPTTIIQAKTVPRTTATSTPNTTSLVQRISSGTTINKVPPSTANTLSALSSQGTTVQVRRPAIVIKRDSRSIKNVTLDLIEKNPETHLGLSANRLSLLKNVICPTTKVSVTDCYLVLKKLKLNEDFSLLADYFEMTLEEVHHAFTKALVQLARYLKFLIKWNDKNYFDRHKDTPITYRPKLSKVQSLIECVETDIEQPESCQYECRNYKFILSISTNDIICYVSEVYLGIYDDLTIFQASKFKEAIPKHFSLVCDPAKGLIKKRRVKKKKINGNHLNPEKPDGESKDVKEIQDSNTDSAEESTDETTTTQTPPKNSENDKKEEEKLLTEPIRVDLAAEKKTNASLLIIKNKLKSKNAPNMSIPTTEVKEPICREQISKVIDRLRSFKILQHYAINEPMLYQYLSEIVIVVAALFNLQR